MNQFRIAVARAVVTALMLATMLAQQPTEKADSPKPVPSPSEAVLEAWNDVGDKLITMAEDFPEDKYDFKAAPAQRTFGEVLLHVAGTSYVFSDSAQGREPRPHDLSRGRYKTKADVVTVLKQALVDGAYVTRLEGFFAPRNAAPFNRPPGEVGPWAGNYGAKVDPTVFFDEKYEFTLGGDTVR